MTKLSTIRRTLFLVLLIVAVFSFGLWAQRAAKIGSVGRSTALGQAQSSRSLWDCRLPAESRSEVVATPGKILAFGLPRSLKGPPDSYRRTFTAAVWSPRSDGIVFVAPTEQIRSVSGSGQGTNKATLMGISVNELWYYDVVNSRWNIVTRDGANPIFSKSGDQVFFLENRTPMSYEIKTGQLRETGSQVPNTYQALLRSQPIENGIISQPSEETSSLMWQGANIEKSLPFNPIEPLDRLTISPDGQHIAAKYAASDGSQSLVMAVFSPDAASVPVFQDCPYSAAQITWNPQSSALAYPVDMEGATQLHFFELSSRTRRSIALPLGLRMSGLSFSPNGRYLVFAGSSEKNSWQLDVIDSETYTFQTTTLMGTMPHWSPDGRSILYSCDDNLTDSETPSSGWCLVEGH